jgi:hypothetical protein
MVVDSPSQVLTAFHHIIVMDLVLPGGDILQRPPRNLCGQRKTMYAEKYVWAIEKIKARSS